MSTHVCFERHKDLAVRHEECVHMWLEDSSAALRKGGKTDWAGIGPHAAKTVRCALAQQRLAVREYREAARLRPRDPETKRRFTAAKTVLRKLQVSLEPPQGWPLRRFLAHYNLSIRYWDLGKAREALAEAERACAELRAANLPCGLGCAEHNLVLMTQVQAEHCVEQRRLQEAVKRSPATVGPNYDLGVLYFDKRQLVRADTQLRLARDRARAASALQLVEHDRQRQLQDKLAESPVWLSLEDKKTRRMADMLDDIEDDLGFIAALRQQWCVEEISGTALELQETGARDGPRPKLLPCLRRRYSQESQACCQWWSDLCKCT